MAWFLDSEYENLGSSLSKEGGFATVYKVRHRQLGYVRAIRVLKETIENEHDPKYQSFLRECQLLLRLGNGGHPNIVRITQPRLLENRAIVEMEFIHGHDLYEYIKNNHHFVPIDEVLHFVRDISSALAYCHVNIYKFCMDRRADKLKDDPEDGRRVLISDQKKQELINKYKVIHNDLHSKNVMRKQDGNYVLLDFGLSIQGNEVVKSSMRKRGGAPEYKAPEKWKNNSMLTEQSDVYSFGILWYEMLAGRVPFILSEKASFEAMKELCEKHLYAVPPSIESLRRQAYERIHGKGTYRKDYPQWMERIIMKCLAKLPENRYQNAKELKIDIKKAIDEDYESASEHSNKLSRELAKYKLEAERLRSQIEELAVQRQSSKETYEPDSNTPPSLPPESEKSVKRRRGKRFFSGFAVALCLVALCFLFLKIFTGGRVPTLTATPPVSHTDSVLLLPDMVYVQGGTFMMGCTGDSQNLCESDEHPLHSETVDNFYICRYEVTAEKWKQIMGVYPLHYRGDSFPVEGISWNNAQTFIARLNTIAKRNYRLPTEVEWEYAARGGNRTQNFTYSGSNICADVAWVNDTSVHLVGSKQPNELGIYDMSGNVWEWCSSDYIPYDTKTSFPSLQVEQGKGKVIRGGSWFHTAERSRVSNRHHSIPEDNHIGLGFRLAADAK